MCVRAHQYAVMAATAVAVVLNLLTATFGFGRHRNVLPTTATADSFANAIGTSAGLHKVQFSLPSGVQKVNLRGFDQECMSSKAPPSNASYLIYFDLITKILV